MTSLSVAAAVASSLTWVGYAAAAPSIGYFLVTALLSTVTTTSIVSGLGTSQDRLRRGCGMWVGTAAVWLYSLYTRAITAEQWADASLLLGTSIAAVSCTVAGLERLEIPLPVPTAMTTTVYVAWYLGPIWMPGCFGFDPVVRCHPGLTLNGVLSSNGIWAEQPVAYQLTTLGQDVAYTLPRSIWPAVTTNLGIAVLATVPVIVRQLCGWSKGPGGRRVK